MRISKINKLENYIPPKRWSLFGAVLLALFLVAIYAFGIFETLSIRTQSQVIGGIVADLYLFFYGSKSLYIDENGVSIFHFGIRTRHVLWRDIDQVGTGHTDSGVAIVITLKGHKRYAPIKDSGCVRDAEWFSILNHKGCILIENAPMSRSLVEKFYGELDYEWNPPNYD